MRGLHHTAYAVKAYQIAFASALDARIASCIDLILRKLRKVFASALDARIASTSMLKCIHRLCDLPQRSMRGLHHFLPHTAI